MLNHQQIVFIYLRHDVFVFFSQINDDDDLLMIRQGLTIY